MRYLEVRSGWFYFRRRVAGVLLRWSLETQNYKTAIKKRDEELAILSAKDAAQRRRSVLHAIDDAEQEAAVRERVARDGRLRITAAWDKARSSPHWRPITANTEKNQRNWWGEFEAFIVERYGPDARLAEVTRQDAMDYARLMLEQEYGPASYNARRQVMRKIWDILTTETTEEIGEPWKTVPKQPVSSKGQRAFTREELTRIFAGAEGEMRLLVLIGYHTWMRLKTCVLLPWADVSLQDGWIRTVHHKTGAGARIPLHPELAAALSAIPSAQRTGDVLPDLAAKYRVRSNDLVILFNRLLKTVGISRRRPDSAKFAGPEVGFHSFRHTGSTGSAMAGNSPAVTQAIRGDTTMTQQASYIHVGEAALRDAIARMPSLASTQAPTDSERLAAVLEALQSKGKPAEVLARVRKAAGIETTVD